MPYAGAPPAHEHGPWVDDYLMMARKTVLKRAMKYVRLTPQAQDLLTEDDARQREDIPVERHAENIQALFGDGGGADPTIPPHTPQDAPKIDAQTGEVLRDTEHRQDDLWAEEEARQARDQALEH